MVKWSTTKINFLGYEIENGKMSLKTYLKKKIEQLGRVRNVNDLERIIGIISYARHFIKATELILAPLRSDLKDLKKRTIVGKIFGRRKSSSGRSFQVSAFQHIGTFCSWVASNEIYVGDGLESGSRGIYVIHYTF